MAKPLPASKWTFEELARNIHRFTVTLSGVGEEQWFLLQSDVHWDNPCCDRDLLKKHWAQAKDRNAPILDNGDFFCAMQGKWDKRSNKDDLRPEHQNANYLDSLVATAGDYMKGVYPLLTLRGKGNHETNILKKHETDLTERLVERIKTEGAPWIAVGGYSGFVVFQILTRGASNRTSIKLQYHHGYGGGGPVTRGVIQTNRQAVYLADADICWNGHTHDTWQVPIARIKLNQDCTKVQHCRQVHIRTAGYKEEYGDGFGGWHIERGGAPKPVGAAWLRIYQQDYDSVEWELTEAK